MLTARNVTNNGKLEITQYGTPQSCKSLTGPRTKDKPASKAAIAVQHIVEVITSFLSFGMNKSLFGSKWEPVFPGLLFHWRQQYLSVFHTILTQKMKKEKYNLKLLTYKVKRIGKHGERHRESQCLCNFIQILVNLLGQLKVKVM